MFRIPLRIGKNNDLRDDISDLEGMTERGLSGRRSQGALSGHSIFEEKMAGSGFDMFIMKDDLVDIDNKNLPIELMGKTGLHSMQIPSLMRESVQQKSPILAEQSFSEYNKKGKPICNEIPNFNIDSLEQSICEGQGEPNDEDKENSCRGIYQQYINQKFNQKKGDSEMLDEIFKRRVANSKPSFNQEQEQIESQVRRSKQSMVNLSSEQFKDKAREDYQTVLHQEAGDDRISCKALKDQLRDVLKAIQSAKPASSCSQEDLSSLAYQSCQTPEDFVDIFKKLKENILQWQERCTSLERHNNQLQDQLAQKDQYIDKITQNYELKKQEFNETIDTKESLVFLKEEELQRMTEQSYKQLQSLKDHYCQSMRELDHRNEKLQQSNDTHLLQNEKLLEKLQMGKFKYEKLLAKLQELKATEGKAKQQVGTILSVMERYNQETAPKNSQRQLDKTLNE